MGWWLALLMTGLWVGQARAQAPAWQSAVTPGAGGGSSFAVDAAGNVYVTGGFDGTATFGTTTLTSAGGSDLFVAKRTPSGTYQWVAQVAGAADEYGAAIAVDAAGNVYVTGGFASSPATFGPTISLDNNNPGGATYDVFVAKLNAAGVWQLAVRGGGSDDDVSTSLAVDGSGNAYVTGYFRSSTATFGPTGATPITLTNTSTGSFPANTFVAKLDAAGIYQWATSATGFSNICSSVVVNGNDQVYISGAYRDSRVMFGPIVLPQPLGPIGSYDLFVARLTAAGAWEWAIAASSRDRVISRDMALDESGNLLITGGFSGRLTLGATTLTNVGGQDVFAAKLNPAGAGGAGAWTGAVRAGGYENDYGRRVALDGSGNAYLTGVFEGPAASFGPTTLTGAGRDDVFVAKLTPTGTWEWATQAGGTDNDGGAGVAVDGNGAVYVTGYFRSDPASFGSILLSGNNPGNFNSFIAHLNGATGVGLPEDPTSPRFTLAPNPAHHTATLTGAPGATATLLDGLGRTVRTAPLTQGAATLDVRGLPAGLYVVRAGGATRRLVVE